MEAIKYNYCCASTIQHCLNLRFADCIKPIGEIITAELCLKESVIVNTAVFDGSLDMVFDMEYIEELYDNPNGRDNRVDMSFVVKNNDAQKVVLVELKLNCSDPNNVKPVDIVNKINGSSKHFDQDEILNNYFLIFPDNKINLARNILQRRQSRKLLPETCNVATLTDLHKIFFE